LAIPDEIGRHVGAARSAGNQLEAGVDAAHLTGRVAGLAAVLARLQLADLPRTVHLVAEAPGANVMWLGIAVRAPQVAPFRAAVDVAVLDVGDRLLRRAGAEVHPQQRLGAHQPAPVDEFVGAELIRLERIPRAIENGWPLGLRADAIEPVVARDEISSWITNDGHAKLADLAGDIRAKAARIGHRRAGFINTRVDGPPEVLEEGTEEPSIEIAHARVRRDTHSCGPSTRLRGSDQFEPGTAGEQ